jgi:hypothetical protein
MPAIQGMSAPENTSFDLNEFIGHFKALHDEHCHQLGKVCCGDISVELKKANTRYPHPHHKIATGEYFTGDLIDFFKKYGVQAHPGIGNEFFIYRKELENSALTQQLANQFLADLEKVIRRIEAERQECVETLP